MKKKVLQRNRMLLWEKKAFLKGASLIIGLDEAGRGPLAGPVVAGAVMLHRSELKRFSLPRFKQIIDDSKRLTPVKREEAFKEITKKSIYAIGKKDQDFIDNENINKATIHAMQDAVISLIRKFCSFHKINSDDIKDKICLLVDGNLKLGLPYTTVNITKGDSRSLSIAAASIVAKVIRDRIMAFYDKVYPEYGFLRHKGYCTKAHIEAIRRHGPCPIHRKTFAPIRGENDFCQD